jgi:hypothetical protein
MDDDLREQLGNAGDRLDRGVDHTTDTGKEAWRRSDGDDSLADRLGNAGDERRRDVTGHR